MGKKEDISDLFQPEGIKKLKRGQILRFKDADGVETCLKVTRTMKTGSHPRVWAEHVTLGDVGAMMSHAGHMIDVSQQPIWCDDCEMPVSDTGTIKGNNKADERALLNNLGESFDGKQENGSNGATEGTEDSFEGQIEPSGDILPEDKGRTSS